MSLFLVAEIFYLSWLPNGRLGKETYLPLWLLNLSNTYFNLRTAIPFTVLSFLIEACYSIESKPLFDTCKIPFWLINITIATVIVCLAEGGQFFITDRYPDLMDVTFGIFGSILGCVLFHIFNIIILLIFIIK